MEAFGRVKRGPATARWRPRLAVVGGLVVGVVLVAATGHGQAQEGGAVPACAASITTEIGAEIAESIGFPVLHDDVLDPSMRKIACHDRFCTEFNGETKSPIWVIERLTPDIVTGDNPRPRPGWSHDTMVSPPLPIVSDNEYKGSGFARGHMAASADFKCSVEWMEQTFIFSNAVPQIQNGFNGSVWRSLESRVQKLAKERSEIFVITGTVHLRDDGKKLVVRGDQNACGNKIVLAVVDQLRKSAICDDNDAQESASCAAGVAVPSGLFKIVYVPASGRAFAFLMSNEDHRPFRKSRQSVGDYLEEWRVSIGVIQDLTNLQFFPDRSLRTTRVLAQSCTATRWR